MTDPRVKLKELIAATSAWQGMVGAEGEDAAEVAGARIFIGGADGEEVLPHLVIGGTVTGDNVADGLVARHGELVVDLHVGYDEDVEAAGGPISAGATALWSTYLAPLEAGIMALQGTGTYLILRSWDWDYQVLRDVREAERAWRVQGVAKWGIAG